MKNDKLSYGLMGFVLGILSIWVFASFGINGNYGGMQGMMGWRPASNMMGNIDEHFIEQMIPHHDDAITMANIALQKAEHQEIKALSQNIIKTQTDEIAKMRQWYASWFGKAVPDTFSGTGRGMGMIHNGMMGDAGDITDLETAKPFDKEFIEQMIPHHQMAVMMAQMLKNSTSRPEMKQLAEDIISTQTSEIGQMRSWHQTWYK